MEGSHSPICGAFFVFSGLCLKFSRSWFLSISNIALKLIPTDQESVRFCCDFVSLLSSRPLDEHQRQLSSPQRHPPRQAQLLHLKSRSLLQEPRGPPDLLPDSVSSSPLTGRILPRRRPLRLHQPRLTSIKYSPSAPRLRSPFLPHLLPPRGQFHSRRLLQYR